MVDFLFALIELFCCVLWFWFYKAKCGQLSCFRRGRPLCTQILPGWVLPVNHSWHQKARDTGLADVEYHISLHSLNFDTMSECDALTDGQTDLP